MHVLSNGKMSLQQIMFRVFCDVKLTWEGLLQQILRDSHSVWAFLSFFCLSELNQYDYVIRTDYGRKMCYEIQLMQVHIWKLNKCDDTSASRMCDCLSTVESTKIIRSTLWKLLSGLMTARFAKKGTIVRIWGYRYASISPPPTTPEVAALDLSETRVNRSCQFRNFRASFIYTRIYYTL